MSARRKSEDVTINLTPMIDVVFLLVIFFMVGSKFSEAESRVDVSVASAAEMQAISRLPDKRIIDVESNGTVLLDGQVIAPEVLFTSLQEQFKIYPGLSVLVRNDNAAPYGIVDQVLLTVRNSGVSAISVAGKAPAPGQSPSAGAFR